MQDVMIDVETLDTRPSAALLSIGAVRFDINTPHVFDINTFHVHIDIDSCLEHGRTVSGNTILWWMDQNDEARQRMINVRRIALKDALLQLSTFINSKDRVWGNGAGFDNVILADAYRSVNLDMPWRYWSDMCYRTVKNLHRDVRKPDFEDVKHDALADALHQAVHLQMIYQKIRQAETQAV